ncbi:MAG: hypothetical protein RBR22_08080 [Desulfuromonas sp.]|nr:hypothetical protein [Desulfuromonas sp.]
MPHQTVEVVAKNRAALEALAARLGLGSPIKLYISSKLWVATFLSKEEQERMDTEHHLKMLGY